MIRIANNGIITMTAGDTFKYPMFINAGNIASPLRYILTENDKVCLSIKEPGQPFEHAIVRKVFTKDNLNVFGDVVVELDNSDTENLVEGTYYYEVRLLYTNGDKTSYSTIIPDRKFYIL